MPCLQVDINRPWQRLLEKVENAVSTLVRDSLLLTEICADDAELVLRAWSSFILNYKPKSLGEGGRSVIAELVSKLEGILVLVQRLNNKINSYSKAGMYGGWFDIRLYIPLKKIREIFNSAVKTEGCFFYRFFVVNTVASYYLCVTA